MNDQWNAARLELHRARHNRDEAREVLAASDRQVRQAAARKREIENEAHATRVALTPWPLPSYPLGRTLVP